MQSRAPLVIGGVLVGVLGLGAVAVAVLPVIFHDRIVEAIDRAVERQIRGEVAIGDLSLSLLRTFPRMDVRLTDVAIQGEAPFQGIPLLEADELRLGLDLWSMLRGDTLEVRSLRLIRPRVQVLVLEDGQINTDLFLEEDEASESSDWTIELDDLVITDLSLRYEDRQDSMNAQLDDLDVRARGELSQQASRFDAQTTIGSFTVESDGVTWLRQARVSLRGPLVYENETGAYALGENELTINALRLAVEGRAAPAGEDWDVDARFSTRDTSFATLLSLVPGAWREDFEGVETSGTLALTGSARGRYASEGDHLPAFDLAVDVTDARFKYPDLPTAVEDIELDLRVQHPEGPMDLTELDLRRLAFTAAGATLEGAMKVAHPTTDPLVDARFAGQVDLDALGRALPAMEGTEPPSGKLDVDVSFAGRASDFSAPNPEEVQARGSIQGRGLTWDGLAVPLVVEALDLGLSPERADIRELRTRFQGSDLSVAGHLDNLLGYAMSDSTLTGALDLSSRSLDLRPFQGTGEQAPQPEQVRGDAILLVPTDLSLVLQLDLGKVVTEEFALDNARGEGIVRDGAIRLDDLQASLLGGKATLSGTYRAPTVRQAAVDLRVDAEDLQLVETLGMFETLSRVAPLLEGARGRFDARFSLAAPLLPDGSPDLAAVDSQGTFAPQGVLLRPEPLRKVAQQLGQSELSTLDIGGARVSYVMKEGSLELEPFSARLGDIPVRVRGSVGVLARTLDLDLDLKLPTAGLARAPALAGVKKALGRTADVSVHLEGPWDAPRVNVAVEGVQSLVEGAREAADQAIDALMAEARAQGDVLLAEAEKRAAELRAAARQAGDKLREEADRQGDKLVREARGKPLQEAAAREAARALRAEADKAAKRGEAEADKAADKVLAEARQKRQALLDEVERKRKAGLR